MNITNIDQFVQLISLKDRQLCEIINFVFITNTISLFGVVANVMNIIVFYKQGFNNTINISFFALTISDLCSLITLLWFGISVNPLFINGVDAMAPYELLYLTSGLPHLCFVRISGWITIFMTAERCLCIMIPLKIKQVITPKRTKVTVCAIYAVTMVLFIPEYQTTYIDWRFYPDRNRTVLRLIFSSNHRIVQRVVFFVFSVLGFTSFVAVITFTVILVVQLRQKSKWRNKANADKNSDGTISSKERKTVTMVIMIATVLIICYTPGVAVSMVTFFEPEFSITGKYANTLFVLWTIALAFDAFNSSVNIFLYYNMSTKYRETFRQIFVGFGKTDLHDK